MHKKYVDASMLSDDGMLRQSVPAFRIADQRYFPFNNKLAGDFFSHNEFRTVYEISADFEHYDIPVQG